MPEMDKRATSKIFVGGLSWEVSWIHLQTCFPSFCYLERLDAIPNCVKRIISIPDHTIKSASITIAVEDVSHDEEKGRTSCSTLLEDVHYCRSLL